MTKVKSIMRENFLKVDKKDTVSSLSGKMRDKNRRNAFVFDGDSFEGVIRKRGLLRSRISPDMKVGNLVKKVGSLNSNDDLVETAYQMFNADVSALPVMEDGELVGFVHILDVIKETGEYDELNDLEVEDVKIEEVDSLSEEDKIARALEVMRESKIYDVPIEEDGDLVGVISVSDVFEKYISSFIDKSERRMNPSTEGGSKSFKSERPKFSSLPVSNFDTTLEVKTVRLDDNLVQSFKVMAEEDVMSLIVLDKDDKVKGVLTAKNALRPLASLHDVEESSIQFAGFDRTSLDEEVIDEVKDIVSKQAPKIEHYYSGDINLRVVLDSYHQEGSQEKFSIQMMVSGQGRPVEVDSHDWDIKTAIRKGLDKLNKRLEHRYKE